MDNLERRRLAAVGLCATCRHRREQASRRGSVFYRCARADLDPAFPRYPPLPVARCAGFEPEERAVGDGAGSGREPGEAGRRR